MGTIICGTVPSRAGRISEIVSNHTAEAVACAGKCPRDRPDIHAIKVGNLLHRVQVAVIEQHIAFLAGRQFRRPCRTHCPNQHSAAVGEFCKVPAVGLLRQPANNRRVKFKHGFAEPDLCRLPSARAYERTSFPAYPRSIAMISQVSSYSVRSV